MTSNQARARIACLLAAAILFGGCATTPSPSPVPAVIAPAVPASDFTIAAVQLDAWNALGQILVNTPGVAYRSRAQMLGLYEVDYRGERLLLITHGIVLDADHVQPTTTVRIAAADGSPAASPAAIDLLQQVQARLPGELQHIASLPATEKNPPKSKKRRR
ncbi:MAG: hypothetical protein JSR34_09315 [Proteobacteria bacterium]|nr:hypothetical protein [Pseudomonadota bacterium]